MRFVRDLSIRYKLTALTAVTTTLALAICCALFVNQDIQVLRRSKTAQLTAIADVLAENSSAALSFGERGSATDLLSSLEDQRTILAAWIVDNEGQVFAEFTRRPGLECPRLRSEGSVQYSDDGTLYVRSPIARDGVVEGMLVMQDSLVDLRGNIVNTIIIMLYVLVICVVIGLSVALPLHRMLSQPILELATTAQQISQEGDIDIRVNHDSLDEIGILYEEFNAMLSRIKERDDMIRHAHDQMQKSNDLLEERVHTRTQMFELANQKLKQEMQQRERASKALTDAQAELLQTSRKAGMADVANSVLHNVGNVLNSLNVSAAVITERVREMRIAKLQKCIGIILNHDGDLSEFLESDDKGKIIPQYLPGLVDNITRDQQQVLIELESLTKNVEHIKDIVRAQQSHAGRFGVIEKCQPQELMEDALQFSIDSIRRHGIVLERHFEQVPDVLVEKARLLQVLVNLIKNAKESIMARDGSVKRISLGIRQRAARVEYRVSDTGGGIDPNKLTSIFSHGFTTKADGHGFGLHASANFVKEMGGELTAQSDGVDCGATFVISLPVDRAGDRLATAEPELTASC